MATLPSHQTAAVKDAAVARKRRRASTGRVVDNCFTCTKRNVKCDRQRPYCSQCLRIGSVCSGYKTQLTWDVGVASRGKLRGLSLPIANAPPVTRETNESPVWPGPSPSTVSQHRQRRQKQPWSTHNETRGTPRRPLDIPHASYSERTPTMSYLIHGYDYLSMLHPETAHIPQNSWNGRGSVQNLPVVVHSPDATAKHPRSPFYPVTDEAQPSAIHFAGSSMGNDVSYNSLMSQSYPCNGTACVSMLSIMYDGYHNTHSGCPMAYNPLFPLVFDHGCSLTPYSGLVDAPLERNSSPSFHIDPFESHRGRKLVQECDNLNVPKLQAYGSSVGSTSGIRPSPLTRNDDVESPLSDSAPYKWPSTMGGSGPVRISAELAANMPFLMDYYRVTVCPSMVLIDGPTNPFREHILQLAANSQSLQHAICALSACNLRIKRMLSLYQDTRKLLQKLMAEKQAAEAVPCTQLEDPSLSEEHQHRNLAISLLNQQLNNPINSDHDSSLATILLLCHYRMAKCGIAEIHTQFAGIKKFLSMRNQHFGQSSNSTWMQGLFTCYGTISASIDGRETRLASQFPVVQVVPRGIENFVGCDRELFKIISKLGRLSLLAQHRTTQSKLASNDARCSLCPLRSPLAYAYKDSMSGQGQPGDTHHPHPHHFDATSFCTALDNDEMLAPAIASSGAYDDYHSMFGYEWKESYLALQKWQFDSSTVAAWLPESPSSPQARDIGNLSETFRYAALLYMERLASPDLPSGHDSFQNLVSQIVYYAMSLESPGTAENFLLWPMFVAGSECIIELQQNIVRSKCRGIVFRSGYMNSMKAFDELERLWAGEYKDAESHSPRSNIPNRRGLLNWAKCMCGPGVDVQWIMF